MKRTTISLPDELADLLSREAKRRDRSVSALVRELVEGGLGLKPGEMRSIPFAAMFHDPEAPRAAEMDRELNDHWADQIGRDRG